MAKVLKINDGKQPGKVPAVTKTGSAGNEVVAVRNGEEHVFTKQIWDNLPEGKDGYQEASESPKKPATAKVTETGNEGGTANDAKKIRESVVAQYKEMFEEDAPSDLSTEELQQKIAEGNGGGNIDPKTQKANLVEEYQTLTGKKNGKTLSIEKLQEAIALKKAETGNEGGNV